MRSLTAILDDKISLLSPWLMLGIYVLLLALIALVAYKKRWLSLSGSLSAVVLGLMVLWLGGFSAFAVFLFFFVSSSLVSKMEKSVNKREKKGSRRDMVQVLANGLPAVLSLMLIKVPYLSLAALAAFSSATAEAAADTWSGSVGMMDKKPPVSILTGTPVPPGLSGGVTALGFAGGFSASLLTALLSSYVFGFSFSVLTVILFSGFLGSVIDSILGALVQVQYRNERGELTEKEEENGVKNERVRGIPWFDNDAVNLVSGMLSSSLTLFLVTAFLR